MNTYLKYIITITIIIIIIIIIYSNISYLLFNENFIIIENNFLNNNDYNTLLLLLNNIDINNINNIFLENNEKKYILLDRNNINYDKIYKIIYNDKLKKIIKDKFNFDLIYPTYDIEYRIYKINKNSMGWHKDLSILNSKYLECIYVIENNTNSFFKWFKNVKFNEYYQKSNDLIIIKPNDLIHNIDPILYGNKKILKFIINLE
jgi:hypothetical protein